MATHEKVFGNVMVGLIAGAILWAAAGSLFGALFGENLFLFAHHGGRGHVDAAVDYQP